jgi:hypothetical protein
MAYEVSLHLTDELYQRIARVATKRNQAIEVAIIEQLDQSLTQSFPSEFQLAGDEAEQEVAAFHALHPRLRKEFPGHYVAIKDGKLIDHDPDRLLLFARIDEKYPDEFVLMRPVEERVDREFHFRSPRLEHRGQ